MSRSTPELLREALVHFDIAAAYAETDELPQLVVDAISLRLSAGLEVLGRIRPDVRQRMFGESWPLMWGMRNRIAHGYLLVDADIVRQTASTDLPAIIAQVRQELAG